MPHHSSQAPAYRAIGFCLAIVVAAPMTTSGAHAEDMSREAAAYLDQALDLMQEHSMRRGHIDWHELRSQTVERASASRDAIDTYPAIRFALEQLGDRHSFLQLSAELSELERERHPHGDRSPGEPQDSDTPSMRREMEARVLEDAQIGYVAVPCTAGWNMQAYADRLHEGVDRVADSRPCGWIVDLRGNAGGNMWPMLAGVGPLIGGGPFGSFVGPEGTTGIWFYEAGQSGVEHPDGSRQVESQISGEPVSLKSTPPVAVLIGGGVGSSGEAVAIAFKGRPDTRFFGNPTYGIPTSNRGFRLPDGANLVITVGANADRSGKPYLDSIEPDVVTEGRWDRKTANIALDAATNWLLLHPNCRQPSK